MVVLSRFIPKSTVNYVFNSVGVGKMFSFLLEVYMYTFLLMHLHML